MGRLQLAAFIQCTELNMEYDHHNRYSMAEMDVIFLSFPESTIMFVDFSSINCFTF